MEILGTVMIEKYFFHNEIKAAARNCSKINFRGRNLFEILSSNERTSKELQNLLSKIGFIGF